MVSSHTVDGKKSGKLTPVEVKVVEIHIIYRVFSTIPGGFSRRISDLSTVDLPKALGFRCYPAGCPMLKDQLPVMASQVVDDLDYFGYFWSLESLDEFFLGIVTN